MDFVLPRRRGRIRLVEAKAGRTVKPEMARPLRRLGTALGARFGPGRPIELAVVHQPPRIGDATRALVPGVQALPWRRFLTALAEVG